MPPPCPSPASAGERLSGLSSCESIAFSRFACFCVEADKQLSGERDAHDHLGFSGRCELAVEGGKAFVEAADDVCDQEQDRADPGAAAPDVSLAGSGAAVIGERGPARP